MPGAQTAGAPGNVVPVSSNSNTSRGGATAADVHDHDKLPIRMLHDRVLVRTDSPEGERRSSGGILIPATAAVGRRLAWAGGGAGGENVGAGGGGGRGGVGPEDRGEGEVRRGG